MQLLSNLAGVAGFEPTDDDTKNRCLTTWRHPNNLLFCTGYCIKQLGLYLCYFFYFGKSFFIKCKQLLPKFYF